VQPFLKVSTSITKVKQVVLPEKKPFFLRVWTDFSKVKQLVLLFQILFCLTVSLPFVLSMSGFYIMKLLGTIQNI